MPKRFGFAVAAFLAFGALPTAAADRPASDLVIEAEIPKFGDFMAFANDALWMMSAGTLVRVGAADNAVVEIPLKLRGNVRGVAAGEGAIWLPSVGKKIVVKVDPATNTKVAEFKAPMVGSEGSIGVGEGSVWVVTVQDIRPPYNLVRFSAADGSEQARIPLPDDGGGVVVDFGSVWVAGPYKDQLWRIDPATNTLAAKIATGKGPRFIASGEGSIWVLNQTDGTVQRFDGKSGALVATIDAGLKGGGGDITVGGGKVWATSFTFPVHEIDPATNTLVARYAGSGFGDAIRYGGGSLWVSGGTIHRIRPPP